MSNWTSVVNGWTVGGRWRCELTPNRLHIRHPGRVAVCLALLASFSLAAGRGSSPRISSLAWADGPITFRNVTADSGVDFVHTDGSGGNRYIVETVASGMATFDYDNDGQVDIYFLNGAPMRGTQVSQIPRNQLYRNLGDFRFDRVTDSAGVGDPGYGLGIAVADYDNDGFEDIYVSNFGANRLYRNCGDGTFVEVTEQAGVAADIPGKVGAGACFLDIDADGDVDLFVANYLYFSYDHPAANFRHGIPIYPGPEQYPPMPAVLFVNEGDGRFRDASDRLTIDSQWGRGMGVVAADYDNDGDADIFVGNDGRPGNFLFENDGSGRFTEVGGLSGTAYTGDGRVLGSMGVECADYNNDGWLDLFVTSYQDQTATLYRNLGGGLFEDATRSAQAGRRSFNHVTWGCALADFDNDGYRDLFFVRGHLIDNIDMLDDSTSYAASPVVLRNGRNGIFEDVTERAGDVIQAVSVGRGSVVDDLDGDGRLDIVILNSRRPPTILKNQSSGVESHWIRMRLVGVQANRSGVGARVKVEAGDLVLIDEVHSGRGYQSHYGTQIHFGLGMHQRADRIEIRWPGGGTDTFENVPADQVLTVIEGKTRK